MKLSTEKSKDNSAMKSKKRGTKFWRRIASMGLCVVLFGTNATGVLATNVSATEDATEDVFLDEGVADPTTESSGETDTGKISTPSDTDTMEDVPGAAESESPGDENVNQSESAEPSDTDTTEDVPGAAESESPGDGDVNQSESADPSDVHIMAWTWVDEEEILTEYEGEWYLSLPGATEADLTEELLKSMLPGEVLATLSNGEEINLPLTWDLSSYPDQPTGAEMPAEMESLDEAEQPTEDGAGDAAAGAEKIYRFDAAVEGDYSLAEDVLSPYVLFVFGGAEVYDANYPGTRRLLTASDNLADHTVQGLTPAGTTVNLFDYDPQIGSDGNDVLPNGPSASFINHSQGINKGALLLFGGSAMREAGFWNQGSGAGRPWGKANVNMKGIVKSTLKDNYPYINLDQARSTLQNPTEPIITEDGSWGDPNRKLMDIANLNHAESENAGVNAARALSEKLLTSRDLTVADNGTVSGSCEKASLQYLFDPEMDTDGKVSHTNVTNLFQVDSDGYYYYDARKNFAEYNGDSNSFTLYDGPAVWRTDGGYNPVEGSDPEQGSFDGDMSLGNFFPFDRAQKVFDSIQTVDKDGNPTNILSSSESKTNVSNAVKANHYMGMTMQVDFTQPENGQLNMGSSGKKDMVFQFSGDDDVWVFIDDVLVLDLGGVHSELYGTIDFATGEVITGQSWRTGGLPNDPGSLPHDEKTTLYDMFVNALGTEGAEARGWVTSGENKIFPTGTEHTLKMFYLERGNYDSSLQMRFNLQPPLYHSIKKVDQNGDPLKGVEFKLYAATPTKEDSTDVADYEPKGEVIGTLTTGEDGTTTFVRSDGTPFSFSDQYHRDDTLYYILKETRTAGGYRALPKDIVLKFNQDTSMLVVQNRYQTGAYASFFSRINEAGTLTYGQFDTGSGNIASSNIELPSNSKKNGLIIAVPMLLEGNMSHDDVASDGKWQALYGSNTEGYGAIAPEARTAEAWRKAVLKAALYQASDKRWPEWRLTYNQSTGRLEGLLEDLPGRADRYLLKNEKGDMKMVYGIIQPGALQKLGITEGTSAELYDALEAYVSNAVEQGSVNGKTTDQVIDEIVKLLNIKEADFTARDFSFLNTDQFQREFRSTIYIPNERRELRVQKVDEDGKGVNGVVFTLTAPDDSTVTGTTANVDGQDGMLIFRPDAPANKLGYAHMEWAEIGTKYILKETSVPTGYRLNETEIPVIVGIYSIYADAGTKDDGVTVMAGVGKLMQTMTKYAADDMVNITLRDITAIAQTQESRKFKMDGWQDDLLEGTDMYRSMNLHYGMNAVVDYGLHDEDGGQNIYPFFTTDVGFLRTRVEQNTAALRENMYHNSNNSANWDDLSGRDITSLFSLLNTVVVTNKKDKQDETGRLRISKTVSGEGLSGPDYTRNFTFTVALKDAGGNALQDAYYYYGEQRAGYIRDGDTISLRHDEALTIRGLPAGTKWTVTETETETEEDGWSVMPETGTIKGEIETSVTVNASFTNYKGEIPKGDLSVKKIVAGNAGETDKDFHFTVTLDDDTVSGQFGDMTFTNGVASFTLKHNDVKTASGLPANINYEVTESEDNQDYYTTDKTGNTGTITENQPQEAVFTNTRKGAEFRFTKVTAEVPAVGLKGAVFKLYQLVCTDEDHDHSLLVNVENPESCWKFVDTQTSNPEVTFKGLLPGEYRLVETKAPNGRVLPAGQWKVEVVKQEGSGKFPITIKGMGTTPPAFAIDGNTGAYSLPNMRPADIPSSGGRGIRLFILLGTLLMGGGLIIGFAAWKNKGRKRSRRVL